MIITSLAPRGCSPTSLRNIDCCHSPSYIQSCDDLTWIFRLGLSMVLPHRPTGNHSYLLLSKYSYILLLVFTVLTAVHNVNLTYSNALYIHLNRLLAKSLWSGDKKAHSLSTKLIALNITDLHSSLVIISPPYSVVEHIRLSPFCDVPRRTYSYPCGQVYWRLQCIHTNQLRWLNNNQKSRNPWK